MLMSKIEIVDNFGIFLGMSFDKLNSDILGKYRLISSTDGNPQQMVPHRLRMYNVAERKGVLIKSYNFLPKERLKKLTEKHRIELREMYPSGIEIYSLAGFNKGVALPVLDEIKEYIETNNIHAAFPSIWGTGFTRVYDPDIGTKVTGLDRRTRSIPIEEELRKGLEGIVKIIPKQLKV